MSPNYEVLVVEDWREWLASGSRLSDSRRTGSKRGSAFVYTVTIRGSKTLMYGELSGSIQDRATAASTGRTSCGRTLAVLAVRRGRYSGAREVGSRGSRAGRLLLLWNKAARRLVSG